MNLKHLKLVGMALFLLAGLGLVSSCGDDDSTDVAVPPVFVTSYDEIFGWDCDGGESCQDVYNIEFAAGTVVDISAGEVTGASIMQIALYAPGEPLGGTNSFTDSLAELRCGVVENCLDNAAGQSVGGVMITQAGVYRLAITRVWDISCGTTGDYRLQLSANQEFSTPVLKVNNKPSLVTEWGCDLIHDEQYSWACAVDENCQDVFDIEVAENSTLSLAALEVTGDSVLQMALYGPGVALGGTNLLTADTDEWPCDADGDCTNNTAGETAPPISLVQGGVYRLAITRNAAKSCGEAGDYRLVVKSSRPISVMQTQDDTMSLATDPVCEM